jgi:hypothetical protein
MHGNAIDLTGQRFGRLVVEHHAGSKPKDGTLWSCVCDCGNRHVVLGSVLRRGITKSCGCYRSEWSRVKHTTHGMGKHPGYRAWTEMHRRCRSTHPKMRLSYLDRGITVCARWSTFEAFWEDMGPTWVKGLTLDRENNDGHYEPGNCRWATYSQQNANQRRGPRGPRKSGYARRADGRFV